MITEPKNEYEKARDEFAIAYFDRMIGNQLDSQSVADFGDAISDWANARAAKVIAEMAAEIERLKVLIKIADVLITNENAQEDWENAKQTRIM